MLEKNKTTRAVLVTQDVCQMDYAFTYSSEGKITIYASQKEISTLMSRLTRLVSGFKYYSGNGVRFFVLSDASDVKIYIEDPESFNDSKGIEKFD